MSTANAAPTGECPYCAMIHKGICPKIKRVEYSDHNPGLYKVVEFFPTTPQTSGDNSIFDIVFGRR